MILFNVLLIICVLCTALFIMQMEENLLLNCTLISCTMLPSSVLTQNCMHYDSDSIFHVICFHYFKLMMSKKQTNKPVINIDSTKHIVIFYQNQLVEVVVALFTNILLFHFTGIVVEHFTQVVQTLIFSDSQSNNLTQRD